MCVSHTLALASGSLTPQLTRFVGALARLVCFRHGIAGTCDTFVSVLFIALLFSPVRVRQPLLRDWLLLAVLLLPWGAARAQAPARGVSSVVVRVSGVVLAAADRRPIPGAGVFVAGSGLGTAADVEGNFQLTINRPDTLVVRAVGFRTRRFTLRPKAPERFAIEVLLDIDSVRLGEVIVTADRPDRAEINRALRAVRRPSAALPAPRRSQGKPIFAPPPVTAGMAPSAFENPISFLYEQFSREGRQHRKLEQWQAEQEAAEQERRRRQQNKAFRDNTGYE